MAAKRNPFNENVNRLMEKIFARKEAPPAPEETDLDETAVQAGAGILHEPQPRKRSGEKKVAEKKKPTPFLDMPGNGTGVVKRDELEFSLQGIRRTTEKIRETTKQMQQMTLQMWANTARKQKETGKIYGEERIPPRGMVSGKKRDGREEKRGNQNLGNYAPRCPVLPQYRMEEVLTDSAPERIRECKGLAHSPQGMRMTKEELFYRQACLMEDYEDDCLYPGDFSWYFPTYQAMNVAQLRGYFAWRTQVRQGNILRAPLSFAFVYVYELLHQIGAKTPEEGFSLLKTFWESYREQDTQLDSYMRNWLGDYVVYYNLDRELLLHSPDMEFDEAMQVFLEPDKQEEEEYFAAVCALSKYNMEGSRFYKEYGKDVCHVVCGVFRAMHVYYGKHGKKTLPEKYFGTRTTCAYQMFASAVFYDFKKYENYEYTINPLHRYRCINGRWSCEKYFGSRAKSKEMGLILRAIDARMRERYEYKALLKPESTTKLVMNWIEKEIDQLLAQKKKDAVPVIEIDVTKLSGIRRAAELTMEMLIVEGSEEDAREELGGEEPGDIDGIEKEGKEDARPMRPSAFAFAGAQDRKKEDDAEQLEFIWEDTIKPAQNAPLSRTGLPLENMQKPQQNSLLNEAERTLLRFLLDGAPYQEFLRGRRLMLSVLIDAINEKLFDHFGDTVIVFEEGAPQVLEDYAEEVARFLEG